MATLFPSIGNVLSRMTSGERRFARRLESHLEDDYLCWYDVAVGSKQLHPDFVILHPRRGILVLEVKDWKLDSTRSIDRQLVSLLTNKGLKRVANPLEQARQYAHAVKGILECDPALCGAPGSAHEGRLAVPWGYGPVLANITRRGFEATDLGEVLPEHKVICQDEMVESVDPEAFQERLWGVFTVNFPVVLSLPQIDRVRWHLFPDIRVQVPETLELLPDADPDQGDDSDIPDIIRIMDIQQEQLARSLGEGHRVIHGVAGSGKTMILGFRCLDVAKVLHKPILVLCYNATLAAKLEHFVALHGLAEKVSVRNFHRWCRDQLQLYNVPCPPSGEDYYDQLPISVSRGVESGLVPRGQYGAILVDEGHDFKAEWLKLIVQMVDPETDSLLLLYDDAQSIYGNGRQRKFSFRSVGIQAQGRTTILRLDYRNTAEILRVAHAFAKEIICPRASDDDGIPVIEPETAGRHGPDPQLLGFPSFAREAGFIADQIGKLHGAGFAWKDIAVIYRTKFMGKVVTENLEATGIPVEWLNRDSASRRYDAGADSVKVMTMHSSKGLEFPVVFIPGIGYLPNKHDDSAEAARLLYVAMTRAMDILVMTHHTNSPFAAKLGEVIRYQSMPTIEQIVIQQGN